MTRLTLEDILQKLEHGESLRQADLHGLDLAFSILEEVDLREANLHQAQLQGAILRGANLNGADLSQAEMDEAGLLDADLRDANLHQADLPEADLRGASVKGADLSSANLQDALINIEQLHQASSLAGTTLPDGTKLSKRNWQAAFETWSREQA